ncbi:MAG: hypothetical protein ACK5L6_09055 [Anaerorhabdus sp.]|uniref:hypothetical protein n=1 Tax=Anaerorhabdus sp. TaxID=1872524 RepID=UPI003A83CCD7
MKKYLTKTSAIYIGLSIVISLTVSYFMRPSFLWIINTLTLTGGMALVIGIFRYLWIKGDFDLFGYRQTKSGYLEYKRQLLEERKDLANPLLGAGGVLAFLAVVLTFFY